MERHCILHVGQPKTGTTAIQRTLFRGLDDPRYDYADLGSENHSRAFRAAFTDWKRPDAEPSDDDGDEDLIEDEEPVDYRQLIRDTIARDTARNLVFSAEAITGFAPSELADLRDFLKEHFSKLTVVAYVRRPRSHMSSLYQQRIKWRAVPVAIKAIERSYRRQSGLQKFDEVFGRDNVHLHLFDPAAFPERDVVRDFVAKNGLAMPPEIFAANESLRLPAVKALFAFHSLLPDAVRRRRIDLCRSFVAAKLADVPGERFALASRVTEPVVEACADELTWLEDRLGASLAEPLAEGGIASAAQMMDFSQEEIDALVKATARFVDLPAPSGNRAMHAARIVHALFDAAWAKRAKRGHRRKRPSAAFD